MTKRLFNYNAPKLVLPKRRKVAPVEVQLDPCQQCGGTGTITVYDSVPYGSTWVSMPSGEVCPSCLDKGNCPKCQNKLNDDGDHCPTCGWEDK